MAIEWKKGSLNQICRIGDGAHASLKRQTEGILYLTAKNITQTGIDLTTVDYIDEKTFEKHFTEKSSTVSCPKEGDILYSIIGSVGGCYIVKKETIGISSSVAIFRPDKNKINNLFLYYYIKSPFFYNSILAIKTGAAQGFMSLGKLGSVEVKYPESLETQQKIAGILSAYDNLIENNRKQIKLLEEAAQKLYKEWFVKLNFPGHENVKIVDGVPEGWKKGILSEIAIDSGKTVSKQERNNFKYYLPIDCLPKKSLVYTTFNSVELAGSSLASFSKGDIIFGAMRPYFHKVVIARDLGLTRNTCFVINSSTQELYAYLVMLLFSEETINYATKISVGTTMPYVRWSDFQKMPIIIPSNNTLICFSKVVIPYFDKMNALAKQVLQLQSARDKLLPKLMNGEYV